MGVEMRVATDDDWPAMERMDGRIFGAVASEQAQAGLRAVADTSRFRLATDGGTLVGIAGSFAFDMTMPGGATVPTAGVTWVSVAVTHRRQGLLGRLMDAIHADADERGEPLAALDRERGRHLRAVRLRHRHPFPGDHHRPSPRRVAPRVRPHLSSGPSGRAARRAP